MKTKQKLDEARTRLENILTDMRSLHAAADGGRLTKGQQERWDRLEEGRANAERDVDEARDAWERDVMRAAGIPGATERIDDDQAAAQRNRLTGERGQAQRLLEDAHRSGQLPDHAAERVESLLTDGPAYSQGLTARWAIATGAPEYRSAFAKLVADAEKGHLLWTPEEQRAYQAVANFQGEQRAMGLTGANGGYMVPLTLDPAIILTSGGSINPLRQVSRVVQTVTDSWQGVTSAGVTAEWKAEAAEVADASPTLGDPSIPVHFGDAFVPFSFEVGQDAVNFLDELQRLLADAADQLQATAFTTGTGVGQPTGIITALAANAAVEVSPGVAETFTATDVYATIEALPPRFRANARWMANLSVINDIDQFETTNGARKFPELDNDRLLRRPLHENSNMDDGFNAAVTADNYLLLVGDFRNFVIVDRIGTTLELVPHLVGANRRPTGQRGALMWFRTGSDSVNDNAFRVLNVATTA